MISINLASMTVYNTVWTHYWADHLRLADEVDPRHRGIPGVRKQGQVLADMGAMQEGGYATETFLTTLLQEPCWGCSMAERYDIVCEWTLLNILQIKEKKMKYVLKQQPKYNSPHK